MSIAICGAGTQVSLALWNLRSVVNEARAPRLAVHDQPSASKPVIPSDSYYTGIYDVVKPPSTAHRSIHTNGYAAHKLSTMSDVTFTPSSRLSMEMRSSMPWMRSNSLSSKTAGLKP